MSNLSKLYLRVTSYKITDNIFSGLIGYIKTYYKGIILKMKGISRYLGHVMDTKFLNKRPMIVGLYY